VTRDGAGRALRAAGAAVVLAALTGGLPAVLYAEGGSPVPGGVPSWQQALAMLARPETAPVFLSVVRAVSWLAWAAFTACAAAEAAALARRRRPARLPGIGPLQGLAAALVSTAVLGALTAPAGAAARPARPAPARLVTPRPPVPAVTLAAARQGRPGEPGGGSYRVREGDSLWDIAARKLGDGEDWHEIWDLNKDLPQPGGQDLTRPGLIQPGWLLRLPPEPRRPHQAPPPRPHGPRPAPATRPLAPRPRPPASAPAASPHPPVTVPSSPGGHRAGPPAAGISLPSGALASASLAAAVTTAWALAAVHRRRRYQPARPLTSRLGPAGPPVPPPVAALRRAAAPPAAGEDDDDDIYGPGPATPAAPGPAARPGAALSPGVPAPAEPSGEIPLGVRAGAEVAADLAALGGLGLTGPGAPAAARAILAALLARALPGGPAGPAEVILPAGAAAVLLPGWHPGDLAAAIPGLALTPSLDTALGCAETLLVRRARLPGGDPGEEDAAGLPPAALIAAPARPATGRLRAVLQAGRGAGLAGIILGDWPPGVTCHVTADGTAACAAPALDGTRLFTLAAADATAVISVLRDACATPAGGPVPAPVPAGPRSPAVPRRRPAVPPPPGPGAPPGPGRSPASTRAAPSAPPPPAAARPGSAGPAPAAGDGRGSRIIRVEVLGPLRITARGQEIRGGLRKARELLAFLAVHPGGVTGEAISEALWPESAPGRGATQRNLALRKLRDLLRAAAGLTEPMLVTLTAERYRLDPAFVTTDVAGFQAALEAAREAGDDGARLAACQEAAALYRGPLADGAGYDWAEPFAEAARRRALDAWTRIAELLEPAGPDQALAALETALGHDPFNEYLYQRIMRLQAAAGRPDAVRRTLRLLEARLTEIGVTPGTQTRQAAAALLGMPGPPQRGGGPQLPAAPRPAPAARQRPPGRHPAR
jgi:DNA-binding SARP family transcriptional activator